MFRFAATHHLHRRNTEKAKVNRKKVRTRDRRSEGDNAIARDSHAWGGGEKEKHYRLVVLGAAAVGKSSIISQFLYDRFLSEYQETVEDMHHGQFCQNGVQLTLDILDTAGAHSFPAMRKLAISTADAFVLVYSLDDNASFEAVKELRDQVLQERGEDIPIVVVGNKADVSQERRIIQRETAEGIVCVEWGNGYVEASAKDGVNVVGVFKEILRQCEETSAFTQTLEGRQPSSNDTGQIRVKFVRLRPRRSS